jgi:putative glutathione S-transferase
MGMLVEGEWSDAWYKPDEKGRFVRPKTVFRDTVEAAEAGRYHLYVSWACPWAHRTLIGRALYGLQDVISVNSVDSLMTDQGWHFSDTKDCPPDPQFGAEYLREIYVRADPKFTGRVTVPILWDKQATTIVNNESKEILRMLGTGFAALGNGFTLIPDDLREASDAMRDRIYEPLNNGVYRSGFARTQGAYDGAVREVFAILDELETILGKTRYLCGDRLTESDICAFTTLYRFDSVYHGHFKCNQRRIVDQPNLWGFLRDVYQTPGVAGTCRLDHITQHYYWSHETVNPTRIVPIGPELDFASPHGRG